jgi:hypothetical protein
MNDAYRQAFKAGAADADDGRHRADDDRARSSRSRLSARRRVGSPDRASLVMDGVAQPVLLRPAQRDLLFPLGPDRRNGRDNSIVSGSVATQTAAVMQNARELLDAAGISASRTW